MKKYLIIKITPHFDTLKKKNVKECQKHCSGCQNGIWHPFLTTCIGVPKWHLAPIFYNLHWSCSKFSTSIEFHDVRLLFHETSSLLSNNPYSDCNRFQWVATFLWISSELWIPRSSRDSRYSIKATSRRLNFCLQIICTIRTSC